MELVFKIEIPTEVRPLLSKDLLPWRMASPAERSRSRHPLDPGESVPRGLPTDLSPDTPDV